MAPPLRQVETGHLVAAVLDERELSGLEDHGHGRRVEMELLAAGRDPRNFGKLARRQVAEQNRFWSVSKKIVVFEDVDLLDLAADVRLQNDARARCQVLHNHLAE